MTCTETTEPGPWRIYCTDTEDLKYDFTSGATLAQALDRFIKKTLTTMRAYNYAELTLTQQSQLDIFNENNQTT